MPWLHGVARREDPTAAVGTKLRRIFLERGLDYFEAEKGVRPPASRESEEAAEQPDADRGDEASPERPHHMTPEELFKMRGEVVHQLQ